MNSMTQLSMRSPIGGAPVYFCRVTDSTMNDARQAVADGAPSGVVVMADFQEAGKGRRPGRVWHSRPGESLMFTLAIHQPVALESASLRAGLAVAGALRSECGLSPRIKWPNDVLVSGRKIAGVLCDYHSEWLYVGIGVNLSQTEFPADLAMPATSVSLENGSASRDALCLSIVAALANPATDWHPRLNEILWGVGEHVTALRPDGSTSAGVVAGIDEQGCLLLESSGGLDRIMAGDITVRDHP